MPLRDHFRPPLDDLTSWDGFHGQWPAMIVLAVSNLLPKGFVAAPHIHLGSSIELDLATFTKEGRPGFKAGDGGVATAMWAPPGPSLAVATDLPDQDEYEVRIYDIRRTRRLVAAVEIVSPANKDRPEHRRSFVAKCAALLQQHVCVVIIDLVTTRASNMYAELLGFLGLADPSLGDSPPPLHAVSCRWTRREDTPFLEAWANSLELGREMPTLPLWISDDHAVPLELERSYEETCRVLGIP